jgi:hypothetical protein
MVVVRNSLVEVEKVVIKGLVVLATYQAACDSIQSACNGGTSLPASRYMHPKGIQVEIIKI